LAAPALTLLGCSLQRAAKASRRPKVETMCFKQVGQREAQFRPNSIVELARNQDGNGGKAAADADMRRRKFGSAEAI